MDISLTALKEVGKAIISENNTFNPDKRIDTNPKHDATKSSWYDVDSRVNVVNKSNDSLRIAENSSKSAIRENISSDTVNKSEQTVEKHAHSTDARDLGNSEEVSGCPIEGHGGHWDGDRGNSIWYPDRDEVPKNPKTNPDGLTWGQILDKYGIKGIPFKNGEPDFSEVSKGTVEIDNFSENRYGKGGNFDQACEKLAEQRGCTKEEVKAWMKENKYTWHERSDCKTMDKVPTEVHGNVRHEGGISEIKNSQNKATDNKEV